MKGPISAHKHIKDHVNIVKVTILSLFMFQWYIMTLFRSIVLQDAQRECLNLLNMCLINPLDSFCSAQIFLHDPCCNNTFTL